MTDKRVAVITGANRGIGHEIARQLAVSSGMGQLSAMSAGSPAYRVSKTVLNALTAVLAVEAGNGILINTMAPGWVRTDMGGSGAPRSVEQGADTAVWLEPISKTLFRQDERD